MKKRTYHPDFRSRSAYGPTRETPSSDGKWPLDLAQAKHQRQRQQHRQKQHQVGARREPLSRFARCPTSTKGLRITGEGFPGRQEAVEERDIGLERVFRGI